MKRFATYGLVAIGLLFMAVLAGAFSGARAVAQTVIKAVLVKNVDEPGRAPYFATVTLSVCNSLFCTVQGYPSVPTGKRLVITNVNGFLNGPGQAFMPALIGTGGGGIFLPVAAVTPGSWALNSAVSFYVEEGSAPSFATIPGVTNVFLSISGYLIDKAM